MSRQGGCFVERAHEERDDFALIGCPVSTVLLGEDSKGFVFLSIKRT